MTLFHLSHKVFEFLFNYFCLEGWCVLQKILPSKVLILPKKETLARSPFGLASARPVPSRVLGSDVGGALKGQTKPITDISLMRHSQRCAAWGPCQSDRHASRESFSRSSVSHVSEFKSPKSLFAMLKVRTLISLELSHVWRKRGEAKFASSTTGKSL
jgi:hypothetical protein